ncbi:GNAT family N-acetyltransferase [Deinococcus sp.]|uniref:GNAT family N-acetyltransferase n=1 Tax=Deinococcus sp. TaxID=47478 RepID=UPI003CC6A0F9
MTILDALLIRPEIPADIADIAEVTRRAFDRTKGEEVEMVANCRASARFIPELSLVAVLDDRVIGHVLTARTDLHGDTDNSERPRRALLLGPISVRPEFQRRGVGATLIRRTLEIAAARPEPMIVLWGRSEYYPRFGFRPASDFGLLPYFKAAMVYPLQTDLSEYAGLSLPD